MLAMGLGGGGSAEGLPLQWVDHIASVPPMPASPIAGPRIALAFAACAAVAGCGALDSASQRFASSITPYKVEVVQGNFVSREQVEALRPGMSRQQVREVLGTPLIADAFHSDRWDYVFTLRRRGVDAQERHLTVWFKGDAYDHVEGDTMPSEAEFVATLDNKRKGAKVPPLEATKEQLERFKPEHAQSPADAAAGAQAAPPRTSYPPLESATR
jgi:outer membrane protein assembly factor BamE